MMVTNLSTNELPLKVCVTSTHLYVSIPTAPRSCSQAQSAMDDWWVGGGEKRVPTHPGKSSPELTVQSRSKLSCF